jgi:NADH-quinone oxidoreductase subunit J
MSFELVFFGLSTLLVFVSTILLAVTKNVIHACVFLLGTLMGVAGLYATLSADFLAVIQIFVYVGGVVILMLFAVMLMGGQNFIELNKKLIKHAVPNMGNWKTYLVGGLTSLTFVFLIVLLNINGRISLVTGVKGTATSLALNQTANPNLPNSTVEQIGMLLVTDYIIPFEIISVLLLGALVGAAIISRPEILKMKGRNR